jgi:hypothetical protein
VPFAPLFGSSTRPFSSPNTLPPGGVAPERI